MGSGRQFLMCALFQLPPTLFTPAGRGTTWLLTEQPPAGHEASWNPSLVGATRDLTTALCLPQVEAPCGLNKDRELIWGKNPVGRLLSSCSAPSRDRQTQRGGHIVCHIGNHMSPEFH